MFTAEEREPFLYRSILSKLYKFLIIQRVSRLVKSLKKKTASE